MALTTASELLDDLVSRLGNLTHIPARDLHAALSELDRIRTEFVAPDEADEPQTARLLRDILLVAGGLVPAIADLVFGDRGDPADHPSLAEVIAAESLVRNTLVKSLGGTNQPVVAQDDRSENPQPKVTNDK